MLNCSLKSVRRLWYSFGNWSALAGIRALCVWGHIQSAAAARHPEIFLNPQQLLPRLWHSVNVTRSRNEITARRNRCRQTALLLLTHSLWWLLFVNACRQWVPNKNEATVCHKRWYYLRIRRRSLLNFEDAQSVHTTGIKNFQVVALEPPSNPCKSLAGPVNTVHHVFFRVFCQLWKLYLCFSNFNSFPITFIDSNSESPFSLLSKRKAFFSCLKAG